jgi:diguanylate cyclase (GGDEF)-like protein
MFIDAFLLIQDVQLLCFCVIFGFVALQHRGEPTRRWLWYSFLASGVGAVVHFLSPHLPAWIARGVGLEMVPLFYALVNVSIVFFVQRCRLIKWISAGVLVAALPLFLLWSGNANHVSGDALQNLATGLLCAVSPVVLLRSSEKATQLPRRLMAAFFLPFAAIELARAFVGFALMHDPHAFTALERMSEVACVVSIAVLPLAFLWMIGSRAESDLALQTLLDPLTQVMNRRGLRLSLDREVAMCENTGDPLSVAILDLDYFKKLNDRYGHASGDAMLIGIASLLRRYVRDSDTVARMGGEEFVLLLPQTTAEHAASLLERLRIEIENYTEIRDGETICSTASVGGTSTRTGKTVSASDLLHEADMALYQAKECGRNRVQMYAA